MLLNSYLRNGLTAHLETPQTLHLERLQTPQTLLLNNMKYSPSPASQEQADMSCHAPLLLQPLLYIFYYYIQHMPLNLKNNCFDLGES